MAHGPSDAPPAEAFQGALAAERARNARLFGLLRFVTISVFLGLALLMGVVIERPDWTYNNWTLFTAYWAASGVILWVGWRAEALARVASLGIPLLDMPAIFFLQWSVFGHGADDRTIATHTIGFYLLLIIGAMVALERRQVLIAGVVAAVLETALQRAAGVDPMTSVMTVLMMVVAALGCCYVIGRSRRLVADVAAEHLHRERLSRYFSPQVAAVLARTTEGSVAGESREVTVLFSDLRGFTALAEQLDGPRVVALLNDYHERMVRTIFAFDGTLDKYLGDGLMVYFGAPVAQADHAERAVRCAQAMQLELTALNAERVVRGEAPLRMGIGIHTGTAILGDIGAAQRREYTIVGDTVNVAARLEQLTKAMDLPILVSDTTRAQVGAALPFAPVGQVEVRGRARPLEAYGIGNHAEEARRARA